jgi:50S ribosomal subunit-associated GTPase HflX
MTVNKILSDIAPKDKLASMITVYNKCDLSYTEIDENVMSSNYFMISSKTGAGVDDLEMTIEQKLMKLLSFIKLSLRIEQGSDEYGYLNKNSIIKQQQVCVDNQQFIDVQVFMNKTNAIKFIKLFPNVKITPKN